MISWLRFHIVILLVVFPYLTCKAIEVPKLVGMVNDYALILQPDIVSSLNQKLKELEASDSTQLMVLTVKSLGEETIEDFANKVFNTWGIGGKKLDNGVLLVISFNERKIRIEVGRGLEGKLPDVLAGRIIRDDIAPLLKKNNWDEGITVGVDSIVKSIKGEYEVDNSSKFYSVIYKALEILIFFVVYLLVPFIFVVCLLVLLIAKLSFIKPQILDRKDQEKDKYTEELIPDLEFSWRRPRKKLKTVGQIARENGGGSSGGGGGSSGGGGGSSGGGGGSSGGGGGSSGGGGASGSF